MDTLFLHGFIPALLLNAFKGIALFPFRLIIDNSGKNNDSSFNICLSLNGRCTDLYQIETNMLKGCVFKNGLWFRLTGDPSDLVALYASVRKLLDLVIEYELHGSDISNLLVGFLEKIESANLGKAEIELVEVHGNERAYYGFCCTWMELLMCNNLMRLLSEYTVMDDLDEINMQLLEHLTRKAISQVDREDIGEIYQYIGRSFVCLDIKRFIAGFSCSAEVLKKAYDPVSLREVLQYLNPFFVDSIPSD